MLGTVLGIVGLALSLPAFYFLFSGPPKLGYGLVAIVEALGCASASLEGKRLAASIFAGLCAVTTWLWWNSGGGDGTKRRLRSLGRAFRGVRRTAPVAGGAS